MVLLELTLESQKKGRGDSQPAVEGVGVKGEREPNLQLQTVHGEGKVGESTAATWSSGGRGGDFLPPPLPTLHLPSPSPRRCDSTWGQRPDSPVSYFVATATSAQQHELAATQLGLLLILGPANEWRGSKGFRAKTILVSRLQAGGAAMAGSTTHTNALREVRRGGKHCIHCSLSLPMPVQRDQWRGSRVALCRRTPRHAS